MPKRLIQEEEINQAVVEEVVKFLESNGAGTHVRRSDAAKVSCGMLNSGTLANADSAKPPRGPDERVTFGTLKKVSYPIESLARYMVRRGFMSETRQGAVNE